MKDINILKNNNVNLEKSLELFGDIDTYNEMLENFLTSEEEKIKELEKFKTQNDMPNYAILVHSLKSDARTFGFDELGEMAYEHEMKSKAGNMYFVFDHFDELMNETNKVLNIVREYLGKGVVRQEEVLDISPNSKKILVVDDSNIIRIFVEKVFNSEYNVISASDGNEALEILKNNADSISAMLLDLNMPNCDGIEVLNYMNENNLFKKVPVAIITGEDSNEVIENSMAFPVAEVLTKPFNERDIKRVVEKTVNYNM